MQEGPAFSSANSVLNADKSAEEPTKKNKTKEAMPTTGEKGEVAQHNEKTHRETVHGVFEDGHSARGSSGNVGQYKSRSQLPVPE